MRFRGPVLIDGGLPLAVPGTADEDLNAALDTDDLIAAVLGPAAERLSMSFATVEEYLAFFAAHPAFADGLDTVATESFVYDLAAKDDDSFQPSTSVAAMQEDSADMYSGTAYPAALEAVMGDAERQADVASSSPNATSSPPNPASIRRSSSPTTAGGGPRWTPSRSSARTTTTSCSPRRASRLAPRR